ncbi:MAG TPA: hypothetical protein VHG89_11150 [Verrucomicrobiae bacterium]|nr:hypothetical protein [Verrucomicrobiae bacterium]
MAKAMFSVLTAVILIQLLCIKVKGDEPTGWLWSRRTSWQVEAVDGPLNGTNSQSSTFIRQFVPPFYVPAPVTDERAWTTVRGKKLLFQDVAKSIDSYCAAQPEFQKWKLLQSFVDGQQQRFAPYKFWIVSVDPIVVILTPFDIQNPDGHSNSELSGAVNERMEMRAPMSGILVNCYNFGTEIENTPAIKWFAVGSNSGIMAENFGDKELILTNQDLVLKLVKNAQGTISVSRISKTSTSN